jgi:hypothetical protein
MTHNQQTQGLMIVVLSGMLFALFLLSFLAFLIVPAMMPTRVINGVPNDTTSSLVLRQSGYPGRADVSTRIVGNGSSTVRENGLLEEVLTD